MVAKHSAVLSEALRSESAELRWTHSKRSPISMETTEGLARSRQARKPMSPYGYHGRYFVAQLDALSTSRQIELPEAKLRQFLGGSGLGAYIMLEMEAAKQPAVAAPLAFVFSPLVGSPLTTSAKFAVVCKSPLTNRFNDALASSGFAISGKATGYDAIVLAGIASRSSVLLIDNGEVRLEPADDVWGMTTSRTEAALKQRFGPEFEFAVIGPAGEKQVRYASISHAGRHAGRGGAGAVLGGKRIKAVAVRGTKKCEWHNPDALNRYAKELSKKSFGPATAKYRELGTATNLLTFNRLHSLPTRNFQQATFDAAESLAPETLTKTREKTQTSCRACTIGCEHLYQLDGETSKVRLEYENLFALGPLCGVSDADMVLRASKLCDELGMDTISTGGTIAFAMECVERGLLDEPWLRFGDGKALLTAIERIGSRRGLGDRLAVGSRELSKQLGDDAYKFAPHVKGMELPGYEPRTLQTMALGFAVGTRGADHNRSSAYEVDFSNKVDRRNLSADAVALAIAAEDRATLLDSLILCKFLRGVFEDLWSESAAMLQLVTGWDIDGEELKRTAKRIVDTKKTFNVQSGWTPAEDTLPDRFFDDVLPEESTKLSRQQLADRVREYNLQRGWDEDGYVPATKFTLDFISISRSRPPRAWRRRRLKVTVGASRHQRQEI